VGQCGKVAGDLGDGRAGVCSQGDKRFLGDIGPAVEGADGFSIVSLLDDKGLFHRLA